MRKNFATDWPGTVEDQAGVADRSQALRSGVSRNVVRRRLGSGQWRRLHRGVYATFSGAAPRDAQLWAALLRAGPGATLSHHTAAELHGLIDSPADQIHVTSPRLAGHAPLVLPGVPGGSFMIVCRKATPMAPNDT